MQVPLRLSLPQCRPLGNPLRLSLFLQRLRLGRGTRKLLLPCLSEFSENVLGGCGFEFGSAKLGLGGETREDESVKLRGDGTGVEFKGGRGKGWVGNVRFEPRETTSVILQKTEKAQPSMRAREGAH
jgi:hypothetical protein